MVMERRQENDDSKLAVLNRYDKAFVTIVDMDHVAKADIKSAYASKK